MYISELIRQLEKIREREGEIEVERPDGKRITKIDLVTYRKREEVK